MTLKRLLHFSILLLAITLSACQGDIPGITSHSQWQITKDYVIDAKLSERGEYSALLLAQGRLEIWHNTRQERIDLWPKTDLLRKSTMLAISPDARFLITANDNALQIWQSGEREPLGSLNLTSHLGDASITDITFWQAPHKLIIGTSSGVLIFADIKNNLYQQNQSHSGDVTKLLITDNGAAVISGGNDGRIIKWSLNTYYPTQTQTLPFRITSLTTDNKDLIFASDALKTQIIWDTSNNTITGQLKYLDRNKWFRQALFINHSKWLVTSSPKAELLVWDLNSLELKASGMIRFHGFGSTTEDMKRTGPQSFRTLSSDSVIEDWELSALNSQPAH